MVCTSKLFVVAVRNFLSMCFVGGEQRVRKIAVPHGEAGSGNSCGVLFLMTGDTSCCGLFPAMHSGPFPLERGLAG